MSRSRTPCPRDRCRPGSWGRIPILPGPKAGSESCPTLRAAAALVSMPPLRVYRRHNGGRPGRPQRQTEAMRMATTHVGGGPDLSPEERLERGEVLYYP